MSRRHFIASLSTLLCVAPFLEGVVVNNATDLNNAIIAANATGDPSIQFGGPINLTTFTIDGLGNSLLGSGMHRGFFARQSTGTVTI